LTAAGGPARGGGATRQSRVLVDHWWDARKERRFQARMQASLDALDAQED